MKIEKLMWASTDQLRQEMVSKINEIIDKVNEPVEMNSPAQRNGALSGKKEECARCEFDKLPGEYTLPFNYEIPHSCKEDKKEEPKSTLKEENKLLGKANRQIAMGDSVYSFDIKEEPKPKCVKKNGYLGCYCGKCEPDDYPLPKDFLKEPKSTLKEKILSIILPKGANKEMWSIQSEMVLSLFKDTLLKEVQKAEPLRIPGESLEFTSGQEWTMRQIKQIIKNL